VSPYHHQNLFGSLTTAEATFRDQVEMSDWAIIKKMKVEQGIQ
jgi:translation initiation factor 5B